MRFFSAICLTCVLFVFTTCKKHDFCPEPPKKDSTCELVQSFVFIDALPEEGGGRFSQYRKEYDNSGTLRKVVAGLFTFYLYDSVALRVQEKGTTIYFLDEKNPTDTFITATFDAQHRLLKITEGNAIVPDGYNPFPSTNFYYDSGRLSAYEIVYTGTKTLLTYDANGNIVRMYNEGFSPEAGTFFTYDLSVTAKRQFYSDYFENGGEISIYLAQFMGWLPDLEPVNKRTSWKEVFDEDPPYVFSEGTESGHVYDGNGNLVSYNNGGYTNIWRCAANKN